MREFERGEFGPPRFTPKSFHRRRIKRNESAVRHSTNDVATICYILLVSSCSPPSKGMFFVDQL